MAKQSKKSKLKELKQADGKDHSVDTEPKQKRVIRSLDDLWGTTLSKYNTTNLDAYKKQLAEMNRADMQREATKIGLVPIEDRRILTERLVKEFIKVTAAFNTQHVEPLKVHFTKKALDILSEGGN